MLYDADIRDDLCDYFERKYGKVGFFDELVIGKSRADIVLVTPDALIGVEIKSDADTYARLPGQIKDYDRFFDMNYIVAGGTHGHHILEHVPGHWGVITTDEVDGKPDFYELRKPAPSPKVRLTNQMGLLWRSELAGIQKKNGLYKYADKSKMYVKKYIMDKVDHGLLKKQMIEELFDRDYTRIVSLFVMIVFLLTSVISFNPTTSYASGIRLNKKSISLTEAECVTLQLKGAQKKVTWTSSDPSVATVTAKGKNHVKATVKAVSGGATVITAKYKKKKFKCKVTVTVPLKTPVYTQITQEEAMQMMARDDGHVIVDVRREDEYAEGHIPGAILIPNETIGTEKPELLPDLDQIILVYCRSGNRSKQASQKLADIGYTQVYEFGGIITWPGAITK